MLTEVLAHKERTGEEKRMKKKERQYAYDNSSLAARRYRTARGGLLGMMLLTVFNTVMAAIGEYETYFVFSDYLA